MTPRPRKSKNQSTPAGREIPFTVASALLRELGERLVGQPHIALAELVKNSYDADATKVVIRFEADRIKVIDNGHGMNEQEFRDFWMRIGSPHKQVQRESRNFHRPVTGSKGVGRLAAQFLARRLEIHTVSDLSPQTEIVASVDWDEAVKAGDLVEAKAHWRKQRREITFPDDKHHGTALILSGLNQTWGEEDLKNLAREIWPLQPPFRSNPDISEDQRSNFAVALESPDRKFGERFDKQMRSGLDQWEARIVGKLLNTSLVGKGAQASPKVAISVEFKEKGKFTRFDWDYSIDGSYVHHVEFEVRIFRLIGRKKEGIKIEELRDYLKEYGGVHIYDSGFHLPYYGPDTDWLGIERDHAARIGKSVLLPEHLYVERALQFLPSTRRIFGVVHINTNRERGEILHEARKPTEYLQIQVTRDRLVENEAFKTLVKIVRTAIDFYATQAQILNQEDLNATRKTNPVRGTLKTVTQVLDLYREQIPPAISAELHTLIEKAIEENQTEAEQIINNFGLMGALATAGISALAFEHEVSKQFNLLTGVAEDIASIEVKDTAIKERLVEVSRRLEEWIERARATQALFSHLTSEENRTRRVRFKAKVLIDQVTEQIALLLCGVEVENDRVDSELRLPEGSFAEWSTIFQNIFINAFNAMLDAKVRCISVSSSYKGNNRSLLIQDPGKGVDLPTANELFKPFVRKLEISPEKRRLGMGGTGLGLTIVKMIAGNLNCKVRFVEPERHFKTAFEISWTEK